MSLDEKLNNHFSAFENKEILEGSTVLALSKDGRVYGQLGKRRSDKDIQSLGALLVGMWQASEAIEGFLEKDEHGEMALSFQDSRRGFFILRPSQNNPEVFWGLLFERELNPGKVKLYFKRLRDHFDKVEILNKKEINSAEDGSFLFKDITDDEVDKLFSFAGL